MVTTKELIDNLITANAKHIAELTTEEEVKQWLNSLLWAVAGFKKSVSDEELDKLAEESFDNSGWGADNSHSSYIDGFKDCYRAIKNNIL